MAALLPAETPQEIDRGVFAELYKWCKERNLDNLRNFLYYEPDSSKNYFRIKTTKGHTLMHEAVESDQPDVIQLLLQNGISPEVRGKNNQTPLHLAASKGHIQCVQALLEGGADLGAEDDLGNTALSKAERSKRRDAVLRLLRSRELVYLAGKNDNHVLEKRLTYFANSSTKPEMRDIEEALLQAVLCGADNNIAPLILAGARRLDCALFLAIQKEHLKAIAMLMLCKATITGDCQAIRSLVSEPPANTGINHWFMPDVHKLLAQGTVKMYCPIAVSIMVKNFDVTRELLLCTDLDMRRKQVDWSRLKLTLLHPSWIYSIAPWVVNLKLSNNNLRKLPQEFLQASQLRRLDLSANLLESISVDLFSLPNLEWLNLSQNKLRELPEDINWSSNLANIDLSCNSLSTLPTSIQNSSLEILQLSGNKFTTVPKCICRIRSLTTLDLSSMPISSLPKEMDMLEKLANLNVTDCNINDFPTGAVSSSRLARAFVKSRSRSSKQCNVVKLIALSNSSVGKVVLFSRLRQILCPPGSHLPEMEFFQWTYRPFKFFGIQKLVFNTWMVGVQREYRSLYPCLYTSNALYMLVWDMTKTGDIQHLKPYIDSICQVFPNANILVIAILPEPFEAWADANISNLGKKLTYMFTQQPVYKLMHYHGLVALSGTPAPREATVDLRMRIYEIASQMMVNGSQVTNRQYPENYFHLLPIIEKEHTNLKTSGRPGIMEESALWSMFTSNVGQDMPDSMELPVIVSFLQEAGHLMHFDDPNCRLNQYYFLHPEWIISTIHRILQHLHYQYLHRPIVSRDKLISLLQLGGETESATAVMRLLIRFAIVLPISNNLFLIPSLLPYNAPPLAILKTGCYRRQFIPKGRPLPDDFWYYMISHLLFHIPRLLGKDEPIVQQLNKISSEIISNTSNVRRGLDLHNIEGGESGKNDDKRTVEEKGGGVTAATPTSPLEHKALGQSLRPPLEDTHLAKPRSYSDNEAIELLQKSESRSKSSPNKMAITTRVSTDPIKLLEGILIWRTGVQLITNDAVQVSIYSQSSELGLEETGVEVCVSGGEKGRIAMAQICWLVQKILEQRYPNFSPKLQPSSHNGLTQIILCPMCMKDQSQVSGATNFIIETCFVALKEQEAFSHNCHHHTDAIPLKDLIPDYVLVDLPLDLCLNPDSFLYQESRQVYRDNSTVLCDGMFNNTPVTVKKHLFSETKSYTVPMSSLRQEMEMLTHLNHPNIIRTFGYCLSPPIILLERSPMGTLLQKLSDNEQRISRLVRFHISCQVASALAYLHDNNIIYRTLKSDSILTWSLDFEEEVSIKLAHFDRAAFATPSGLLSKAEFSFYPAPEMVRYEFNEEYNEKVDIFSFGVLLYELVARWQPFASDKTTMTHKPKLTGLSTYGFQSLLKLMEECWEEDATLRPTASSLVKLLGNPRLQCHLSTQTLRDCVSVRGCCFVPSLRQVWAYGEYNVIRENSVDGTDLIIEGTQVFILNAMDLTVQGSLELKERANAICTVDCKVWVGMLEACVHIYDSTSFNFTDRIFLKDSVTDIATNDKYAFVGLANGTLTYFEKLKFPQVTGDIKIGEKAIISMLAVGECLWVVCGNEIIVLCADDDQINIVRRLTACQPNNQVYALVFSQETSLVWSIIRSSLVLNCWDASTCMQTGSLDLTETLTNICSEINLDASNLRLLSLECSHDVIWVGVSVGVIVLLTATPQPKVVTWFKAHRSGARCLMKIPDVSVDDFQVVLSGGFGDESYIKSQMSIANGVIMSWQGLSSNDLQIVAKRAQEL